MSVHLHDKVEIKSGILTGLQAKVIAITEDEESRTYTVELLTGRGAYAAGEQVDFHLYELRENHK